MKKRMKWFVVNAGLVFMTVTGMGCNLLEEDVQNTSFGNSESVSQENLQVEEVQEDTQPSAAGIEEQVLFDDMNIKITATGMEDGWLGTELTLLIENNSSQNITVQARNTSVNDYMVTNIMSVDVAAGKKANDSLTFETSSLKECGIDTIAEMEVSFHIFDMDSWDDIVNTEAITIATSVADSVEQTYDDSGNVLLDTNGVRIIEKGLTVEDSFWGPGIVLYIENNTDQDITVQSRDVSVNGFMMDSIMSEDVIAGKKAIGAVQFFSTDMEENSIEQITDVGLKFSIINMESYDTIFDSDEISITYK